MDVEQILSKRGLKLEDLTQDEQETLFSWMNALESNQLNVNNIREYIRKMEEGVSQELAKFEDVPTTWLSILCLLIPLVGIIRKWYIDQKKNYLLARLRNYYLLGSLLSSPDRARKAIETQIANIKATKK